MQITKHFKSEEFDCHDGTKVPQELMPNVIMLCGALEVIRYALDSPLVIVSAYRHPLYNKRIGGAKNSQHLEAKAVDIISSTLTPKEVYYKIETLMNAGHIPQGGLGLYKTFVHYDIRGSKARWEQ